RAVPVAEAKMLPLGACVHGIAREHRIDARVEGDLAADLRELVGDAFKGGALPAGEGAQPQRAAEFPFAAYEQPGPVVVLLERQIGPARDRSARGYAIERTTVDAFLEIDPGPPGAAPGQ